MGLLLPPFIVLISLFAVKVAGEWLIFKNQLCIILRYVEQDPEIYFTEEILKHIEFVC